jgi:hypothetical protein
MRTAMAEASRVVLAGFELRTDASARHLSRPLSGPARHSDVGQGDWADQAALNKRDRGCSMSNSGNDDLTKLRIDPNDFQAPYVPTRIRKRRKDFAMLPMSWYDTLANPVATGSTVLVAWHLCHLAGRGRMSRQ